MNRMVLWTFFVLVITARTFAQELNCDVIVNFENISSSARDNLRTFEADVEKYMNSNRWTDEDLGGEKIECTMTIFFLSVVGENRYTAQAVIVSQRPVYSRNEKSGKNTQVLRILDEKWEFSYSPGQQMAKDEFRFDPLTDFLDFYAYLIIGFDLETYTELSASRYFQKALNIGTQASSTPFAKDWQAASGSYSRFGLADELMNLKYQSFRLAFYGYHFDGIDLLATEPQKGLQNMLQEIETIAQLKLKQNPQSMLVRMFFDAKFREIADVFLPWPDRSIYDRLIAADQTHQNTYEDYRRRQ